MIQNLDPDRAASLLMETLSATFADMAFVDIEPERSPVPREIVAPVRAAIDVLRPLSCRLEIECPATLKSRIEETLFMGDGPREEEDALLEILNVTAGQFLSAYFGAGSDIKLELPHYLYVSDGSEGDVLAEASGDAEGEPIRSALRTVRYRY